jgi:aminoglycoside phosphotransferase (APT) family kinase protein
VTPNILPGWQAFESLAPAAWTIVERVFDRPERFAERLREFTPTLVHGDAKFANFAILEDRVVLLDWSTTTAGPGALDLAWFLCINAAKLPLSKADTIELYRREREKAGVLPAGGAAWDQELSLALATSALRLGWLRALTATRGPDDRRAWGLEEVHYWSQRLIDALPALEL